MTPPYTGAGDADVANRGRVRPDAIRQAIRDLFWVPLNEGRFHKSQDMLGLYKSKPRAIRVRNQNDIAMITHELGHHLSETSPAIREARRAFDDELRFLGPGNQAAKAIGRIRAQNERIERRSDLSDEEKRRAVDANNARIRAIAKGINLELAGER